MQKGSISEVKLPSEINVRRSGWFLVRVIADVDETFRFASTAPWYVEIGGEKMKPDRESAALFLMWAKERKAKVEHALNDPAQRAEVSGAHAKGVEFWERMLNRAE